MKQLIVNADDFNTDRERNRGILEAARRGIVTSTSVLTNVVWPEESCSQLKDVFGEQGIGVHLNLTNGRPVSAGTKTLTRGDGLFFKKPQAWRRALRAGFDPAEADKEFCAQIEALCAAGFVPDHIDGNNHLHIFPGLSAAAAAAARRFGIKHVRLPREPLFWSLRLPGRAFLKKCFLCLLSLRAGKIFQHAGIAFPMRCAGIQVPDIESPKSLENFLSRLPAGSTELMCHPGYPGAANPFSGAARERELRALTSQPVLKAVQAHNIRLIRFSEL